MNVFELNTFSEILQAKIDRNSSQRGYLTQLASAAKIHPSYLSRVLQGSAQLSLDQVILVCSFWSLNGDETQYVMNLAIEERATVKELKKWAHTQAQAISKRNEKLETKIHPTHLADADIDKVYYTHWSYSAIHVALMIPSLQTKKALCRHFRLDEKTVEGVLAQLLSLGFIRYESGSYQTTEKKLHLSNDSPFASPYHASWRLKGLNQAPVSQQNSAYQFTGVYALSQKDLLAFSGKIKQFISENHETFMHSPEETVAAICIDCFTLKEN